MTFVVNVTPHANRTRSAAPAPPKAPRESQARREQAGEQHVAGEGVADEEAERGRDDRAAELVGTRQEERVVDGQLRVARHGGELLERRVEDGVPAVPQEELDGEVVALRVRSRVRERERRQGRADGDERGIGDAAPPAAGERADEQDRDGDIEAERRDGPAEEEPDAGRERRQKHRGEREELERERLARPDATVRDAIGHVRHGRRIDWPAFTRPSCEIVALFASRIRRHADRCP